MRYIVALIALLVSSKGSAEIQRLAIPCEQKQEMCLYWWPKLPNVEGWKQDIKSSYHYSANTQAPDGLAFNDAETVIYAKAFYKPREVGSKNLEQFIANSQKNFLTNNFEFTVTERKPLVSANGIDFQSFSFTPKTQGNWEQVSYAEEKDSEGNEYYLIFTLSSRTEQGYKDELLKYKKFISGYK